MNISRFFFLLAFIFFIGFLGMAYEQNAPQRLAFSSMPDFASTENSANSQNGSTPSGIIISSIQVWLPIYPNVIHDGQWQTSRKGVSYLVNGVKPGEKGNAVFYGHNWPNLLGSLNKIQPGDTIQIVNLDGQTKVFIVTTVQEVSPNDTSVLSQTTDRRITLYTCTGFLDSKRLVVVATYQS